MTATIEYQIADYSGTVEVQCDSNDENEVLFARARRKLANGSSLPLGCERFKVIDRPDEGEM